MSKVGKDKLQLLRQALSSVSSSVKLANQILNEIEQMGGSSALPGLVGEYDGHFMITEAGKRYPVPDNYAAKTSLVYGDKLKMIETPRGRQFKFIEKIPRVEKEAQLVVKDGQFEALGKNASYKLIQSAVKYQNGEEGDKIKILLPEEKKNVPFACLVSMEGGKEEEEKKKEKREKEGKGASKESPEPKKSESKESKDKEEKEEEKVKSKGEKPSPKEKKPASKKKATKKESSKKTASKKMKEKKKEESKSKPSTKEQASVLGEEELR